MKHIKVMSKGVPRLALSAACNRCIDRKTKFMSYSDAVDVCLDKPPCP
jgi:hypothetical protein